jgi:DeoR/GlpR family transcriptional regulator of sugar metabolism
MNIDERRQLIISHVMNQKIVSVNKLISLVDESPATVRRDLTFLEANNYITRTRGYVKYIPPDIVNKIEISEGKIRVAKAAAKLIPENATIFLDSGVSSKVLAMQLTERTDLSVFTNSLSVANVLAPANVPPISFADFWKAVRKPWSGRTRSAMCGSSAFRSCSSPPPASGQIRGLRA